MRERTGKFDSRRDVLTEPEVMVLMLRRPNRSQLRLFGASCTTFSRFFIPEETIMVTPPAHQI